MYNGYSNYQTWAVALWIDNEQWSQEAVAERAAELLNEAVPRYEWETRQQVAENALEEWLREWHVQAAEDAGLLSGRDSVFIDLLAHALDSVDWIELAKMYIEQAMEAEHVNKE